jgi:hypothetical protein
LTGTEQNGNREGSKGLVGVGVYDLVESNFILNVIIIIMVLCLLNIYVAHGRSSTAQKIIVEWSRAEQLEICLTMMEAGT